MRHSNDNALTLHRAPDQYESLLMGEPERRGPGPDPRRVVLEFMKGVQLDSEAWLPVRAGKPDWLSTFLLYGTAEGWEL